jgi:endoglucanase
MKLAGKNLWRSGSLRWHSRVAAAVLAMGLAAAKAQVPGQTQPSAAQAATPSGQNSIAFARVAHLRRGINLSMWYAQSSDYSAARLASFITPADFQLVHDLGFDHVRLSIDPEPLIDNGGEPGSASAPLPIVDPDAPLSQTAMLPLRPEAMARLDETVRQITATGLVVVLDIHPGETWAKETFADEGTPRFLYFWRSFAHHFAATDPEKVFFEVLNEPHGLSFPRWSRKQTRAVAIIRKQAPLHTIVVSGVDYSSINGLLAVEPLTDPNIIYTFHDYEPMTFTHQGASWAGPGLAELRGVPYPSTPENVAPLLAALPDDSMRNSLQLYGILHWDIATMDQRIKMAANWGEENHVPLWCGEFGVYRDFAPAPDRARWIADMRTTLEKHGIGWNMWDYQGSFALVIKKDGVTTVDAPIAEALGLNVSAHQ